MSFDTFIGKSLENALALGMGDPVSLNGSNFTAVVEIDESGTERGARGGRRKVLSGTVTMRLQDWNAASAKEGDSITLPDGVARINTSPTLTESVAKFRVEGTGA